jgi:hypothetical protein
MQNRLKIRRPLLLSLLALPVVMTGCASRAYIAPVEGPRASIKYRLVSPVPEASVFTLVEGKCAERKWIGGMKGAPLPFEKLLDKPVDASKAELSATIAADRPFFTQVFLDVSNATYCGVGWEFRPEESASYEADVSYAGEKCDVEFFKVEQSDGGTPQRVKMPSPQVPCS